MEYHFHRQTAEQLIEDMTCVILCGGKSTRMGEDKALVPFLGRPLVEHCLETARSVFRNILVSVRIPGTCADLGYPVVYDQYDVASPLCGIHAALKQVKEGRILALAVDMPLILPELLRRLTRMAPDADVVIPRVQGYLEPLMAIYSTRCLPWIEECFVQGKHKIIAFFPKAKVHIVEQPELEKIDPKLRSFININSKAGLRAAESWARSMGHKSDLP